MLQNQAFINEGVRDMCDFRCELALIIANDVAFVDFQCEQKVKLQLKQELRLITFSVALFKVSITHHYKQANK